MNSDFSVAVHALVYLDHKAETLSSDALSENICTNPARVRKIMSGLTHAGLVATREGAVGGYALVVDATTVTLRDVADAVGTRFVATSWKTGDPDKECLVASGMGAIMDGIYDELDELCRRRLEDMTIADIGVRIFGEGRGRAATA